VYVFLYCIKNARDQIQSVDGEFLDGRKQNVRRGRREEKTLYSLPHKYVKQRPIDYVYFLLSIYETDNRVVTRYTLN
jgi:hypothetical protein